LSTVSSTPHRGLWPDDQITCQELVELVTQYLEAALPAEQRARFENHLAACPHCRVYLEQMQQTISATGRLTEESVPPGAREELLRAFRRWKAG
jgi:anti-sigma factor RsiW